MTAVQVVPIVLSLFAGIGFGIIAWQWWQKRHMHDELSVILGEKLNEMIPRITEIAGDQTARLAKEKLEASAKGLSAELSAKKELIDEALKRIRADLTETGQKLEKAELARVGSFNTLKDQLSEQRELVDHLRKSTDGLKAVLSNNQLRGSFGEQIAEDLLKMAGFSKGVDYDVQSGEGNGGRPDFTLKLPNGMKINVDVKFPYANLQRSTETDQKTEKEGYLKAFERDIKEKIKQVTTRSYIDPTTDTVDFVVLFVPNELIFSYIYDKMNDTWIEAMRQKVILAGPFSFTAILRLVRQAYETFHIQSNIKNIIVQIKVFGEEYNKYNEEFIKIGDRIDSLQKQYSTVAQTRTRQLQRVVDKIQLTSESDTPLLPLGQ